MPSLKLCMQVKGTAQDLKQPVEAAAGQAAKASGADAASSSHGASTEKAGPAGEEAAWGARRAAEAQPGAGTGEGPGAGAQQESEGASAESSSASGAGAGQGGSTAAPASLIARLREAAEVVSREARWSPDAPFGVVPYRVAACMHACMHAEALWRTEDGVPNWHAAGSGGHPAPGGSVFCDQGVRRDAAQHHHLRGGRRGRAAGAALAEAVARDAGQGAAACQGLQILWCIPLFMLVDTPPMPLVRGPDM